MHSPIVTVTSVWLPAARGT